MIFVHDPERWRGLPQKGKDLHTFVFCWEMSSSSFFEVSELYAWASSFVAPHAMRGFARMQKLSSTQKSELVTPCNLSLWFTKVPRQPRASWQHALLAARC